MALLVKCPYSHHILSEMSTCLQQLAAAVAAWISGLQHHVTMCAAHIESKGTDQLCGSDPLSSIPNPAILAILNPCIPRRSLQSGLDIKG